MGEVTQWLLDGEPAIRWQVMRDLTGAGPRKVKQERARIAVEGWGARILDLQADDGQWGGGAYSPKWTSTTYTMLLLRHFGIDPASEPMRRATRLVEEKVIMGRDNWPFFDYSTELCITGMALALGSYFLPDPRHLPQPDYILENQKDDGGWNCQTTSERSSFHTTLTILEGLLEHESAIGGDPALAEARGRGHEYLLERRLLRSLRTGELVNPRWLLLSFPPRWFYDVLRALDYLRQAGVEPDPRVDEAIASVEDRQLKDGSWPLQNRHPGKVHFDMEPGAGKPSRWNTLRALRVIRWRDGAGGEVR